jgi:membrane-associated phospholipid phosphatase
MKTKLIVVLFLASFFNGNAQSNDSIFIGKSPKNITYKQFIAPVALISGGFILKNTTLNQNSQTDIRKVFATDFHTKVDNYLQYEAVLQIYGGRYLGFKPKNDFLHQTINIVIANAIMGGVVQTMKHSFKEERPDLSDNYSFPSGHTGTAFTNASLLFYEYKDANIWYASSGFLFATATGALRIANNKHYTSDVLTGAGIGLGVGLAVSYWSPFKSVSFAKNKAHAVIYPQVGNNYGIGLLIHD